MDFFFLSNKSSFFTCRTVYCEEMKIISLEELESYVQSEEQISARLTTPLVLTYVDTEKIAFERSKTGFWGWGGSDKTEDVNGYQSKVFGANNVELITKTRTEHLTEEDKQRAKSNKNPLQSFLGRNTQNSLCRFIIK